MNAGDGKAEAWLETFTKTLRSQLPQGQYILTHARKWIYNSELKSCTENMTFSTGALVRTKPSPCFSSH